ncbi:SH3 domain-containing protein [Mesobacterium pallidum]|uniref:SH3 domain-containing protein n=1 Tax=Mesobacterium pallidum TaxID=2872037 RepID=UPI001EE1FA08|nr:SH3 domain-containing protein [Mesobacterium pallidum]
MKRFIFLTFGFMAWSFYELSGGADFQPPERPRPLLAEIKKIDPTPVVSTQASTPRVTMAPQPTSEQTAAAVTLASLSVDETAEKPVVSDSAALKLDADKVATLTRPAAEAAAAPSDMRTVTKTRVNMRNGPGRDYSVLAKLEQGDQVEVLSDNGDGWVKLRTAEGRVGWMADFLLSAPTG